MDLPPVHVVVVAFGPAVALRTCLEGLGGRYPCIVVDNGSDPEAEKVAVRAGAVYLDPGHNLGFAAAANRALAELPVPDCDVLLLNPDAVIRPAAIEHLHTLLHAAPDTACAAPAQHGPESERPDPVHRPFPTPLGACLDAVGFARLRPRGFVIGAILLQRGAALADMGGFDERFFLSGEETDWQRRAVDRGWTIRYCPEARAVHVKGGTDPDGARRDLRWLAGEERYLRKWHGGVGWQVFRAASICGLWPRALVFRGERGRSAVRRARIYRYGPERAAQEAGAVAPPRPRVPHLGAEHRG